MKILFICLGNICRSPMAEFICKDLLQKQGNAQMHVVESRATSNEEICNGVGNPMYLPARRELQRHGIACDGKRAVQLQKQDYERYDLLICMDTNNYRDAKRLFGGDPQHKLTMLMDYTGRGGSVADPWYTEDFETAYRDIYEGCTALLRFLQATE